LAVLFFFAFNFCSGPLYKKCSRFEKDSMISLRSIVPSSIYSALLLSSLTLVAQTASTPSDIQQKLEADFTVSKAAADKSDIVTPGAILVLQKDGLLMSATSQGSAASNTYKDGKISQGIWKVAKMPGFGGLVGHSGTGATVTTRSFVTGEKFWVTKITVHQDSVVFELLSDPISDVRYCSTLKFPFTKGSLPTPDQADASVGEVLKVQPDDSAAASDKGPKGGKQSAAAAPPAEAAAPPAPMAPIAPPPPPTDTPPPAPKTIALKQTKDEVLANFGPPTKVVKLGTKEIDYYPDMKVTFVNNKVTDVQ
jgi:hypothetical protein